MRTTRFASGGAAMTRRQAAGWAVLSLIPLTFIALAAIAGQLAELAVGTAVAAFVIAVAYVGVHLLTSKEPRQ